MENNEKISFCPPEVQTDTELLAAAEKYCKKKENISDIIAFQSVMCILSAIVFLTANLFYPQKCSEIYDKFTALITDADEIIENPIDYIK